MARIPDGEIERIKVNVSVARLAEAHGVALKRSGDNLIGRCPFHDDKTPSLVISADKNLWHCLGACQAGGSAIDWVMRTERVSFRHAVELLRTDSSLAAEAVPLQKLEPPIAIGADDQALLDQVIGYYHRRAKEGPEASAYLARRGLSRPELIERFRIGFVDRTLGYQLPDKKSKAGQELRAALQRVGIVRESGHEHLRGCLTIPIFDEAEHVAGVYGRRVDHHAPTGTPMHWYLPGPHCGVWNIAALREYREIILCEALIDALTFWVHGFRNVTSAYGVEGFTGDHLGAFKRHGTQRVLIAYDRDDAGDKAAARLAEKLMAEGIECYRIHFPKGMDANEYAQKLQPADKSLSLVIRKAAWLGRGPAPKLEPGQHVEEVTVGVPAVIPDSPLAAAVPVASPASVPPAVDVPAQVSEEEVSIVLGERRYRVRGLSKNLSPELLKINLLVAQGEKYHVDTLDLYSARARGVYLAQAAQELDLSPDVLKHDLGRVLLKLEELQGQQIKDRFSEREAVPQMSEGERADALSLLQSPELLNRIVSDLTACGLIGESINKLVAYLAASSRLLDAPLAVVVRSSSAAGKSSLMEAVLALMPEESRQQYSTLTGQSLYYMGQTKLAHKILALAEEEGATRASYALKLLQSEGSLTIASTGKDPATGNLVTQEYHVEGPVMLMMTTTQIDLDPELLNRCLVLTVDEGREQTRAIHQAQRARRTLEGIAARETREQLRTLHRNAQRLLRPLAILNPYAERLTFPDAATRLRRDHEKYLSLIDTIALLHQHQREVKTLTRNGRVIEYIEVTLDDIAQANRLAHEVLGRSLDELPPQTRSLLGSVCAYVIERARAKAMRPTDVRFSRRELREALGLGDTQAKIHLARLVELEYVLAHRVESGFVYELAYDGQGENGAPFVPGLIDVETLRQYDRTRSGSGDPRSAPGRPPVGGRSGGGRTPENAASPRPAEVLGDEAPESPKTHVSGTAAGSSRSVVPAFPLAAASR